MVTKAAEVAAVLLDYIQAELYHGDYSLYTQASVLDDLIYDLAIERENTWAQIDRLEDA